MTTSTVSGVGAEPASIARRDLAVLGALLTLAALLRLMGLPGRGTWDADQGHDMLVLLGLVRDGTIPLLGPPTSIGTFHHGALYYYLLAPGAFLSAANPTAVVAEIALAGVAAVGVTWWLARSIGGPVAGLVAGLVMAVSGSAIDESTFIWNPNLIALGSAIALASAWRAWTTDRARWWLVAAIGLLITMQCHVLGIALVPPVAGLWAVAWRRTVAPAVRRRIGWAGLAGLGIVLVGYLPLLVHELGHDFSETRAAFAFIASGGTSVSLSLPARLLFVGFRILAWPLTGLLTNGLAIGVVVSVVVVAGLAWLAWRAEATSERERTAARWFAVTLLFGWIALTFGAPGLSTVTPLPTDHYHAFLDPVVFVALGLGAAAVWRRVGGPLGPGRVAVAAGIALLVTWNVTVWPRAVAADGGWPAGRLAADRIEATAGDRTIRFVGLPSFKSTEAYAFPLARDGRHVSGGGTYDALAAPGAARDATIVIVCDAIFVDDCGGAAEAAALASGSAGGVDLGQLSLADRFTAAPGRTISVYLPWP